MEAFLERGVRYVIPLDVIGQGSAAHLLHGYGRGVGMSLVAQRSGILTAALRDAKIGSRYARFRRPGMVALPRCDIRESGRPRPPRYVLLPLRMEGTRLIRSLIRMSAEEVTLRLREVLRK